MPMFASSDREGTRPSPTNVCGDIRSSECPLGYVFRVRSPVSRVLQLPALQPLLAARGSRRRRCAWRAADSEYDAADASQRDHECYGEVPDRDRQAAQQPDQANPKYAGRERWQPSRSKFEPAGDELANRDAGEHLAQVG